jgi:hypothetical protein
MAVTLLVSGARNVPAGQPSAIRAVTEPASGLALKTAGPPGAKMLRSCQLC